MLDESERSMDPLKVFVSYAHEDADFRKLLGGHLTSLVNERLIQVWHDRMLTPGTSFGDEIGARLDEADVVLLLISRAFLESQYCYSIEASRAVDRASRGETKVIPVILRPCDWRTAPFGEQKTALGRFMAMPQDGRPIVDPAWQDRDYAFLNIAGSLRKLVEDLRRRDARAPADERAAAEPPRQPGSGSASASAPASDADRSQDGDPAGKAVTRLLGCLTRSNITFFLGSTAVPADPEHRSARPYVIARHLLAKLNLVASDWRDLMPPPDVVATYYAVGHDPETLEKDVTEMVELSAVPKVHQEFAQLIEALNAWRAGPTSEDVSREPMLIVTTALDLALERAFIMAGLPFSRVVQHHGEPKLTINQYRPQKVAGRIVVAPPTDRPEDLPASKLYHEDPSDPAWIRRAIGLCGLQTLTLAPAAAEAKAAEAAATGGLGGLNALQALKVSTLQQPVIYKLRGSADLKASCVLATEQYLELLIHLTQFHLLPDEIRKRVRGNPTLFIGYSFLDPDFRLTFYLFRDELRHIDRLAPRYLLQRSPAAESDDLYRRMERNLWSQIKESGRDQTTISTLEVGPEDFLRSLTRAIKASAEAPDADGRD
jgi:hypothetical protein